MNRGTNDWLEQYRRFRGLVDEYRRGSNNPDQQLRAIYDLWIIDIAEWGDARAAFSLYCRLNRLLNSDFINRLFEQARVNGINLSGSAVEFREKDTIEIIGGWLLGGGLPSEIVLSFDNGSNGRLILMVVKRADDGRFELYNAEEGEVIATLSTMLD